MTKLERQLDKDSAERRLKMAALREARHAAGIPDKVEKVRRPARSGTVQAFWDLVDTSGGADACHPWTGPTNTNHNGKDCEKYDYGYFECEGVESALAHRVVCALTFGRDLPRDYEVSPICDDHLCCNVKHYSIRQQSDPHDSGVPVAEFFAHGGKNASLVA